MQSTHIRGPARKDSNVAFDDYAGSAACAPCHADIVEKWRRSPMHNMTRAAKGARIRAPFSGETFSFKGDLVKLSQAGADRFFEVSEKGGRPRTFKLTRVIGGHYREDFAGIEVEGVKEDARALGEPTTEWVMPVSYIFHKQALRYKGYSVMLQDRPYLHEGPEWNKTCIFCHNTVPYFDTVLGALSQKKSPYQGEVVDPLLPGERRLIYRVNDERALFSLTHDEAARLGANADHDVPLSELINDVRSDFRAPSLVEVGIGCEACHNGARAHAEDPSIKPDLAPKSPAFSILKQDATPLTHGERVTRTCARCHQVLFSGYPFTWEGGKRHQLPGGSNINSGEARDLLLGKCKSQITCTTCHDPHAFDNKERELALEQSNATCTQCHAKFADKTALTAHTHHKPEGEGSLCVTCHMPKKNMSLDNKLTRYHRIASPNDTDKVLLDRPLECALCHTDKSVRELTTKMAEWWKRPYDQSALTALYGSLDANVIAATLERGKPHEQAVALYLVGEKKLSAHKDAAGRALVNDYPIVRFYARDAIEKLAGAPFPVDLDSENVDILREKDTFFSAHSL